MNADLLEYASLVCAEPRDLRVCICIHVYVYIYIYIDIDVDTHRYRKYRKIHIDADLFKDVPLVCAQPSNLRMHICICIRVYVCVCVCIIYRYRYSKYTSSSTPPLSAPSLPISALSSRTSAAGMSTAPE